MWDEATQSHVECVTSPFARSLERELIAANERIGELRSSLQYLLNAYRYQHCPQHRTAARNEAFAVLAQTKEPT
jgi:hypothetical protein